MWLFGEYPEEYENGKLVGAPSTFISGIDKAQAGIAMQSQPATGTPPPTSRPTPPTWTSWTAATCSRRHQHVCVPTGCYNDVLVIDEFNPLDPPSAGPPAQVLLSRHRALIKVTAVGGEDQEFMDLVKIKKLTDSRAGAASTRRPWSIDSRGYTVSKDVYAKTPRAVVTDSDSRHVPLTAPPIA